MHNNRKLPQYLKLGIIIVMVMVFSCYPTFAADGGCSGETKDVFEMIHVFFSNLGRFFSWIWLVLGNFAGVLMTNSMIYGEFMHLDGFLWKIWQMSRTVANYALGFMFIYYLFRYIFFKDDKPPVSKIKDILVASVLVQVSWFMVMVLVDLSTIALATVSSFPSQVMSVDSELTKTFKSEIVKSELLNDKKTIVVNAFTDEYLESNNSSWFSVEKSEGDNSSVDPKKTTIDALLPSPNNLGGPFIYLGATAFKAQKYIDRPIPESATCVDSVEKVFTNLILDAGMVILYSIALALLIVLLVMRLGYLRIFIAISPIVVLVYALDITKIKKANDIFDLKKAIILIFKPAIFALWISLMFIVVVTVQRLFDQSMDSYLDSVGITDKQQTSTKKDVIPKVSSSIEDAGIVSVYLKNGVKSLKDVMLSLITLVLMWQLVKLALNGSIGGFNENSKFSQKMKKMVDSTGKLFGTVGVVPTPKGMMGFNEVRDSSGEYSPLLNKARAKLEKSFTDRDKSTETIRELLGKGDSSWIKSVTEFQKESHILHVMGQINKPSQFVNGLSNLRAENNGKLKYSDVASEISTWIKNHKNDKKEMSVYFGGPDIWDAVAQAADANDFDIGKWWKSDGRNRGFKAFHRSVLLNGGEPSVEYEKFEDFIDPRKGNGVITSKATSSSESE